MRLLWFALGLALLLLLPFLVWGGRFEAMFTVEGAAAWMADYGRWAWAAGVVLLLGDLLLPIPGTAVMAALGYVYGPFLGGCIAAAGSVLSGALGYGLCRCFGRGAALRIVGAGELERGERLFARAAGGWLVALSRWLPLLPEVVACLAGLARMPLRTFFAALACGSVPLGFTFAAVGHAGNEHPAFALAVSIFLPPLLWAVLQPVVRRQAER